MSFSSSAVDRCEYRLEITARLIALGLTATLQMPASAGRPTRDTARAMSQENVGLVRRVWEPMSATTPLDGIVNVATAAVTSFLADVEGHAVGLGGLSTQPPRRPG